MASRLLYLLTRPAHPLPSHQREALGASAAVHTIFFVLLTALPSAPIQNGDTITLAYVSEEAVETPPNVESSPGETPVAEDDADDRPEKAPPLEVAGLELEIEKVQRQRYALFPFATASLPFVDELLEKYHSTPKRLANPFGRERHQSNLPPLALREPDMQRLIDRGWSRRERWDNFSEIARLLVKHDPDTGDAAALVRRYLDQNLLQPYFDASSRDPRFWVMLGLAADHTRLIEFIQTFVRDHPSTRTATELLFMLDEFAQASRDAMLMLLSTDPRSDLALTQEADPDAFALARSIHDHYRQWAKGQGLDRTESLRARFDDVRLRILMTIVESTPDGYGASDARFLAGRILWDRNDVTGAVRWWREMKPDGRDSYAEASQEIAREISNPGDAMVAGIIKALGAEYRRWITFSNQRLESFGYAFDSF
jgi:hypothetical protein